MNRSSSRTFPGHVYIRSASTAASDSDRSRVLLCRAEEIGGQFGNVLAPGTQRRHVDFDAAQTVVQVGSKQAARHHVGQRTIGRGDNPRIDAARSVPADAFHRNILNGAQQLRLRRQRQIRDFVEEERAAFSVLELSLAAAHAGRGSLLDTEELGLEQGFNESRAINGDERPACADG